jgi:hypothetical protein
MPKKKEIQEEKAITTMMHPTAEEKRKRMNVIKEEFTRRVVKCGSSGHIGVGSKWVNKMERFCSNCGSKTTYVTPKTNYTKWHKMNNGFWCHKCYTKTKMAENRITGKWHIKKETKEQIKNRNARRFRFLERNPYLKENPRKGVCQFCNKKVGDEYINCFGKIAIINKPHIHHINYHDTDILKDTIELCVSCHIKETNKKIKEIKKYESDL